MSATFALLQTVGDAVRAAVPSWLVPVFFGITRLGNVGVFLVVFTLDYWFVDRERGAHAIGIVVAGMAVITALKFFFAVPRPPEGVNLVPITGYSFPSGHATGATIAYGTLAADVDVSSDRLRYGVAGLLVALIALSRVVLGVHFVRDVVAGVAIGVAFLVAAFALTGHDPRSGFALAVALGAVALVVSGASRDGVAVFGMAVGAAVVWGLTDGASTVERTPWRAGLVGGVLPVLAGLGYVAIEVVPPPAVVFALTALLAATLVGAPAAVDAIERG